MRTLLLLFVVALLSCGCLRTYRLEQSAGVDTRIRTDGSIASQGHVTAAEREWRGFWPLLPSSVQP